MKKFKTFDLDEPQESVTKKNIVSSGEKLFTQLTPAEEEILSEVFSTLEYVDSLDELNTEVWDDENLFVETDEDSSTDKRLGKSLLSREFFETALTEEDEDLEEEEYEEEESEFGEEEPEAEEEDEGLEIGEEEETEEESLG